MNLWQVTHPPGQVDPLIEINAIEVAPGLQRRSGRSEDDGDIEHLGPLDGHVTNQKARGGQVFVAGVLFLVDHNQAEVGAGREHGAPCADYHVLTAGTDVFPLHGAFRVGQTAVDDSYAFKPGGEAPDELSGQGDFGHEEDGLPAQRLDDSMSQAVHVRFERDTQRAIDAGVFGAPSYVVEGEIFWGQDRLDFLQRRLAQD